MVATQKNVLVVCPIQTIIIYVEFALVKKNIMESYMVV